MRRFRFVGDATEYCNDFQNGGIYDYSVLPDTASSIHMNVEWLASEYPNDWQEVFDKPKTNSLRPPKHMTDSANPLHKDTDLGYFAGLAMKGILSNPAYAEYMSGNNALPVPSCVAETAKNIAKELIKQLKEETK